MSPNLGKKSHGVKELKHRWTKLFYPSKKDEPSNLRTSTSTALTVWSSPPPDMVSVLSSDLCSKCTSIDLKKVFSTQRRHPLDSAVVSDRHATFEDLRTSKCPMCQLFASVSPRGGVDSEGTERSRFCQVFVFDGISWFFQQNVFGEYPFSANFVMLGIHAVDEQGNRSGRWTCDKTGVLAVVDDTSEFGVRHIASASVNIDFVRRSIKYCQRHHGTACSTKNRTLMTSIKVIDCQTRSIITAPTDCRYVALSYVWGLSETETPRAGQTLSNFPRVIEDSVNVTLQLGKRYLWVDRYCIEQYDESAKRNQINQMDLIYSNAFVTIIAAAGEDPHYGLPGVGSTLRKRQPCLKVGDQVIVSSLPYPRGFLDKSKWSTRGWTYQEGILSKRRLIFTDEQVLFECNSMHCAEALAVPLDAMHTKDKKRFQHDAHGRGEAFPLTRPGSKPEQFMNFISEFSKRELKFQQDKINAMRGIFNVFSRSEPPVFQLMGVEIQPPDFKWGASRESLHNFRTAKDTFVEGLCWWHVRPGERNPHFPSWSWAGWTGEVAGPEGLYEVSDAKVWIEDNQEGDRRLVEFPDFKSLPRFLTKQPPPGVAFLQIEALSLQCSVVARAEVPNKRMKHDNAFGAPHEGDFVKLMSKQGEAMYCEFMADSTEFDLLNKSFCGIVCWNIDNLHGWGRAQVIVVQDIDGYAERIGFFNSVGIILEKKIQLANGTSRIETKWESGLHRPLRDIECTRRTFRLG